MRTRKTYRWRGFINQKRSMLITCGLILIPFLVFFIIKAYPLLVVNKDPIKVEAKITYIYHTTGGKSSARRYYKYIFLYNEKIYYGLTETGLNIMLGNIGDTLIIRCNKNTPQYSVFLYSDNPDLQIEKLNGNEYYRILHQEPNDYNVPSYP